MEKLIRFGKQKPVLRETELTQGTEEEYTWKPERNLIEYFIKVRGKAAVKNKHSGTWEIKNIIPETQN